MYSICIYISEAILFTLWWKKIVIEDNLSNFSIRKTLMLLFYMQKHKNELTKFEIAKKYYIVKTLKEVLAQVEVEMLIIYSFVGPYISGAMLNVSDLVLYKIINFLAFQFLVFCQLLKVTPFIKGNARILVKNIEAQNYNSLETFNMEVTLKRSIHNVFNDKRKFIITLFSCIFLAFLLHHIKNWIENLNSEIQFVIAAAAFIYIFFVDKMIKDVRNAKMFKLKEQKIEIQDEFQLKLLEDIFYEMCEKIGVENIEVVLGRNEIENAAAYVEKNKVPKIVLEEKLLLILEKISNYDFDTYSSYVKFFFAHELVHVKYKDPMKIKNRARLSALVWLVIIYGTLLGMPLLLGKLMNNFIMTLLYLIIMIVIVLFIDITSDKRYWEQVAELRADKLGLKFSGLPKAMYVNLWENELGKLDEERKTSDTIDSKNILFRYVKRNIGEFSHPSWKCRIENIMRKTNWGIKDYIIHAIRIRRWKIQRKGWNGI